MITTGMYTPDIMSWDDFKAYYTDAKEIGDESVPGLLYHVEAISGQCVAVAVKVSDDVTLQIVYKCCDFWIKKYDDDTIYFIYCKKRAGQKRAK